MIRYSICVTNFNNARTLAQSIDSILTQVNEHFELLVVDSSSTDGSLPELQKLSVDGKLQLIVVPCSRGKGRQIAFQRSKGEIIISNMDLDDVFQPVLNDLLSTYENALSGKVLRVVNESKQGAVTIAPRRFLLDIGGWPDLNYLEDRYIWGRAAERGIYRWTKYPLYSRVTKSRDKRTFFQRLDRVYGIQRDRIRIGAKPHLYWSSWPLFPFSYLAAKQATPIGHPVFKEFWPDNPKYLIDGL